MDEDTCLKNIVNFFIPIETKDFLTAGFYIKDMDLSSLLNMDRNIWRSFMRAIMRDRIKPIFNALIAFYDNDELPWGNILCEACSGGDLHFVKNCLFKMDSWERDYISIPFYLAVKNGHLNVVSYLMITTDYSPDSDDLTASVKFEEIRYLFIHLCGEDLFYQNCRRGLNENIKLLLEHVSLDTLESGLAVTGDAIIISEIKTEIARRK